MLVAMAVLGLTTYALLLSQPHLLTSLAQSDPGPAFQESPHTCSHADKESVWSQLPHCEPRNTLVEVPLPTDHPNVLNVCKASIQMVYINQPLSPNLCPRLCRSTLSLPGVQARATPLVVSTSGAWRPAWR